MSEPTLIINERDTKNLNNCISTVSEMKGDVIIYRACYNDLMTLDIANLHIRMKPPSACLNNNCIPFTTFAELFNTLRNEGDDCDIEVPMGFTVMERRSLVNSTDYTTEFYHCMTINHVYNLIKATGSIPVDLSGKAGLWAGYETINNNVITTNLMFESTFRYYAMSKDVLLKRLNALNNGFDIKSDMLHVSMPYKSTMFVFYNKPMYIPIRKANILYTAPRTIHRLLYIYDCIANWVIINKNSFIDFKKDNNTFNLGRYSYKLSENNTFTNQPECKLGSEPIIPKYNGRSVFDKFSTSRTILPKEKLNMVSVFLDSYTCGISITSPLDSIIEITDYTSRNTDVLPLSNVTPLKPFLAVVAANRQVTEQNHSNNEYTGRVQNKYTGRGRVQNDYTNRGHRNNDEYTGRGRGRGHRNNDEYTGRGRGRGRSNYVERGRGRGHSEYNGRKELLPVPMSLSSKPTSGLKFKATNTVEI